MTEVCVLAAQRTPIGKFGGALKNRTAPQLGSFIVGQTLMLAGIPPGEISLLILGLARQAGCGPNPARQVALGAGLPVSVPAYTVNQACASGLTAIAEGARHIQTRDAEIVVAAGAESMSSIPYLVEKARWGMKMGHQTFTDAMYRDGLLCPLCDKIMGETVDALAAELSIGRAEQDAYALESQRKVEQARQAGAFATEIIPFPELGEDEHPRGDTTLQSLQKLRPVFAKDGTVTAGNSSGITDGASAVVLSSRAYAEKHGLPILAIYRGSVTVGLEPQRMGLGPVDALRAFERRHGWDLHSVDQFEINEAFAAQVLACLAQLPIEAARVNLKGGAIALGHPTGCSGNRLAVTLVHELNRRGQKRGLASLCVSGGLGICAGFELP